MRRPLCVFCLSALGVLLMRSFLPQMGLLLPSAAIFVACLLVWLRGGRARGYALCLLLGAAVGVAIMAATDARLTRLEERYAGREVKLTAEVESVGRAYTRGRVSAVLLVEVVDDETARFRVECVSLPKCKAGERVRGRFTLEVPDVSQRLTDRADGIALSAEYQGGMLRCGGSGSFRARMARLQAALSRALRQGMAEDTGGVLAAMVVGDRSCLSSELRNAYRGAGLSHILVVSGMHVAIFCGLLDVLSHRSREHGWVYHRVRSVLRMLAALLLVGITGVTPSVLRAAVAVWVSALGVWVGGSADALTSLGVAGVLMCLGNGYAVCDVGFELSFAAVLGTLAGAECARRGRHALASCLHKEGQPKRKRQGRRQSRAAFGLVRGAGSLWDAFCVSICAAAATFPVLVLWGMSATVWAVVSGVVVLWLAEPILAFGLAAALLGLAARALPQFGLLALLRRPAAFCAEGLAGLLNGWVSLVSGLPGTALWFDGPYAALVCLLLVFLCVLAMKWNVRLRTALPTVFLLAALAVGLETALGRDVMCIELAGPVTAPAVVLSHREQAVVLFRGGDATRRAVETQLEKRGVRTIALLVDLRTEAEGPCGLPAERSLEAAAVPEDTARRVFCGDVRVELWRGREGCLVRLTAGRKQFVTLSGRVRPTKQIRADWLLASPARPERVQCQNWLTLSENYPWMTERAGLRQVQKPVIRSDRIRLRE